MTWRLDSVESDALRYFVGKGVAAVGVFLAVWIATRGLGPESYGVFGVWTAVGLWIANICGSWLNVSTQRFLQSEREEGRYADTIATLRRLLMGAVVLAMAVASGVAWWNSVLPWWGVVGVAGFTGTTVAFSGLCAVAQAELKAWQVARADFRRSLTMPLGLAVLWGTGTLSVSTALLAYAAGLVSGATAVSRGLPALNGRLQWSIVVRFARFGLPMGVWALFAVGNTLIGRLILQAWADGPTLGVYTGVHEVVVKIGTLVFMPVVHAVHTNVMARWAKGDHAGVDEALRRASMYQLILGLVLIGGLTLGSEWIVTVLFDGQSANIRLIPLVMWLGLGLVATHMGAVTHKGLELTMAVGTMVFYMALTVGLNIMLSLQWVPQSGAVGVARAYAFSQVAYLALTFGTSRYVLWQARSQRS